MTAADAFAALYADPVAVREFAEKEVAPIFAAFAPHQYSNGLSAKPEGVLETACAHMKMSYRWCW